MTIKKLTFDIDAETHKNFKIACAKEGKTMREVLEEFMKRKGQNK